MRRRLLLALVTVGLLAGGAALAMELALRWWLPNPNLQVGGMFVQDASGIHLAAGWQGRVKTTEFDTSIRIGPDELRDEGAGPAGVRRIVVLGDSFAFGCWSTDSRTWTQVMADRLGCDVVSAGVPNYGTADELKLLQDRGDQLRPDAVVLAFYCGNDLLDNITTQAAYRIEHGFLVMDDAWRDSVWSYDATPAASDRAPAVSGLTVSQSPLRPATVSPPSGWWSALRPSYLYQMLAVAKVAWRFRHVKVHLTDPGTWTMKRWPAVMQTALQATWQDLDGVRDECARRHVPLYLVVIPSAFQLYADDRAAWERRTGLGESAIDCGLPNRLIMAWAKARGVMALDLQPALTTTQRLYYHRDMHWNDRGHMMAGEATAAFLRQSLKPGWAASTSAR